MISMAALTFGEEGEWIQRSEKKNSPMDESELLR
jgi:hypothetical protein